MPGLYNNNNNPIPGNGADVFGDKLVGNQFVDGTSQFTLGNFSIASNFSAKNSRDFSLGNFSAPITLETLQINNISESKILASNKLEVFIKFDRSKVSNYTLYGSLRERLKVAVQQVMKKFPASMKFTQFREWIDYLSGETATNISFNPNTNETTLNLNLYTLFNPFGLEFTQSSLVPTAEDTNIIRNLLFSFKKYSLYLNNIQYPLSFIQATSGNTNEGSLSIKVIGDPFSGNSSSVNTFYLKPNTLTTEESFDSLSDIEKFLVERNTIPLYTAKFEQPQETANGVVLKGKTFITWPSTEDGNIIISGSLFDAYLAQLFDIADTFDKYKTNLVSRFLTTAAFKEFDTYDEKVDKILKIYGRSFDDIKKYIDGLAYMTNVTYDSQNNVPNELLKNLAHTLGWGTPSAIKNEGFLNTLFKRNENPEYPSQGVSPTPSELDFELYRRLLVNTAYLFKSKGTRRGIEFMLRFVGAPEALIEFNEHVYVAGQPMNMEKFKELELKISGGTYTEEYPVLQTYFSAATNTFPPVIVTGFSQGYETVTKKSTVNPKALPVDKAGYPTVPHYGPNAYFQAGAGWFEETIEHRGKEIVDYKTSVFTGNTPFIKTKLNQFTYGEPYLQLYRKFPDSKLGFPIVRTVDNKKSWVKKDSTDFRYLNLPDRGTNYQTKNDKLVVNVKNIDVFLNVGQGLEWDVWNFSKRYSCPFGPNILSAPYPGYGGPDWTEILADATKLSFFEFAQKFWTVLINVKNRQTIDDGHAGGYPTLLSIYLDYMNSNQTCGIPSNNYTYEKMIEYVESMGDYWIRLLEQLIPATTIWQGGIKYENSIFHRYKYAYKHEPLCDDLECFGSFVNCCGPIFNDLIVEAAIVCDMGTFTAATWHNKITLGGSEYTGNTFYNSTDIYDIPSTAAYLEDMTTILSGITTDVTDPNHVLNYYQINDNTGSQIPSISEPNCVVIQGPCSDGTKYPEGNDLWNVDNGYDPHYFTSYICFTLHASSATTGNSTCEYCLPHCVDQHAPIWVSGTTYNYHDIVSWGTQLFIWESPTSNTTPPPGWVPTSPPGGGPGPPSPPAGPPCWPPPCGWVVHDEMTGIPFLGGNNFMEGEDCDNFDEVIEPPTVTGTTVTTYPQLFKDAIFNVGGQDCFESTYEPCEELVDPCACTAYYGQFDPFTVQFSIGDVVCCPGNKGTIASRWVRTDQYGSCRELELFWTVLCETDDVQSKCWSPCDAETSGENRSKGGIWGKEIVERPDKTPTLIVNDYVDPCDPSEPTPPTNECLECEPIPTKNIDLDFYNVPLTTVPQSVIDFVMNEDQLGENFTIPMSNLIPAIQDGAAGIKKARVNICCLGDKFTHYLRVYHRLGGVPFYPTERTYGDVQFDFNVNQNCIVEFYYVYEGPIDVSNTVGNTGMNSGKGQTSNKFNNPIDRLYMYIPPTTISTSGTISIIDNPIIGSNSLTTNPSFEDYFYNTNGITIKIGKKLNSSQWGDYRLNKVADSLYLTDNGTGLPSEEFNDIFDRYWASDPVTGNAAGTTGLYGAITINELINVVTSSGVGVDGMYRYNWEMQLSCNGVEVNLLTFTPFMNPSPLSYTNGDVPFSSDCGTDMNASMMNQNETSDKTIIKLADKVAQGNVFDIPLDKTLMDMGSREKSLKNYTLTRSDIFIVSNTNPLTNRRVIEYNSPAITTTTTGPTSETFMENNRKRIKLGWLDKIGEGTENNLTIEFVSSQNRSRFSQDLKHKSVGNGAVTLPSSDTVTATNEERVNVYNDRNNRQLDINVVDNRGPDTKNYVTYTDLRDWATNTIGEVKDFSNKQILFDSAGLVNGFQTGPTYLTTVANSQYQTGLVPIGDVESEFLISTMGSLESYLQYQTGSTSSGLTVSLTGVSTNYSGYTNLSGYTNNQEQNLSPDYVFDISIKGTNMSLYTNIAMSDPTYGEFRLLGDDRQLQPSIPLPLVDKENVLFNITRQDVKNGGEYFYYKVPQTQDYRLQYKSYLNLEYHDDGWCEYLDTYRNLTQNTFPNNDYEFKQLINSSLLYNGGFPSAPVEYQEGNIANIYTQPYGYLTPVFGYNPNKGFGNFSLRVYIERTISGTTSATTLGNYTIASNSTVSPYADETLIFPYNDSDKFTDLYQCTGMTASTMVFNKQFTPYIDTGCVTLNKGDEIRLKTAIEWVSTSKVMSGTSTGTSVTLTLGSDYTTSPESRPWFRIINKECNVNTSKSYLYWQPNEETVLSTSFMDGTMVPPAPNDNKGKLILLNSITEETNYLVPKISKNNLQELTYLDTPDEKNYKGPLKLVPTAKKTNRWVKAIEEGRITDYKINDGKMLNKVGDTHLQWNIPVSVNDSVESISVDDSSNTFIVQSTLKVKGTANSFDIINTFQPDVKTETIKEPKNESKSLFQNATISYTSSRPLENRTIDFREKHTIIRKKVVIIESGVYDKDTPTPTPSRSEYCQCGRNQYIEIPKTSSSPCSKWCCANAYKDTEYYGCKDKSQREWAMGLEKETLVTSRPLQIIEGKPPGVIRF